MILSAEQAALFYQPKVANDLHLSLINSSPTFFSNVPFVQVDVPEWNRNYRLEDDMTDNTQYADPLPTEPAIPPIAVASEPVFTFGQRPRTRNAQWKLTEIVTPFTQHKNEKAYSKMINPQADNVFQHMEFAGRNFIVDVIRRSATPPANRLGGIMANLASFDNTTPALTQGYGADVLAQQSLALTGTIWGWDATSTGVTADDITVLNQLLAKVENPTGIIVPERYIWAMINSYYRRGFNLPKVIQDVQKFGNISPVKETFYSYKNVPYIVVPNTLYTLAGHDVTSAVGDYDIFAISAANTGDMFGGLGIAFMGKIEADDKSEIPAGSNTMNVGTGLILEKLGRLASTAGVTQILGRVLSGLFQCYLGTPMSAAVLTGVQD